MNERFETIAEEAMVHVPGAKGLHTRVFSLEKFAELIVRECARVARNTDLEDVDGGDSAVLRAAGEQIEKHFGVEE